MFTMLFVLLFRQVFFSFYMCIYCNRENDLFENKRTNKWFIFPVYIDNALTKFDFAAFLFILLLFVFVLSDRKFRKQAQ